jgi:chromosome segregation ATPase
MATTTPTISVTPPRTAGSSSRLSGRGTGITSGGASGSGSGNGSGSPSSRIQSINRNYTVRGAMDSPRSTSSNSNSPSPQHHLRHSPLLSRSPESASNLGLGTVGSGSWNKSSSHSVLQQQQQQSQHQQFQHRTISRSNDSSYYGSVITTFKDLDFKDDAVDSFGLLNTIPEHDGVDMNDEDAVAMYNRVPSDVSMEALENAFDEEIATLRREKNTYLEYLKHAQKELEDIKIARDQEVTDLRKRLVETRIESELIQGKFRELQDELVLSEARHQAALLEIERLKIANQGLKDGLGGSNESFHESKLQLEARIRILIDEKVQLSQSLRKSESEKRSKASDLSELQLKFDELTIEFEDLKAELDETTAENDDLKAQLDHANTSLTENVKTMTRVASMSGLLETESQELSAKVVRLEKELYNVNSELVDARNQLPQVLSELEQSTDRVSELTLQLEDANLTLVQRSQQIETKSETVLQLEIALAGWQEQVDDLKLQLATALANVQFVESERNVETELKNTLLVEKSSLLSTIDELENMLEAEKEISMQLVSEKSQLLLKLQSATSDLAVERNAVIQARADLTKSEELLVLTQEELDVEREQSAQLAAELENATSVTTENDEDEDKEQLEIELQKVNDLNHLLSLQEAELKKEVKRLKQLCIDLSSEIEMHIKDKQSIKQENYDLSCLVNELEHSNKDMQSEVSRLIESNTDLKQSNSTLTKTFTMVKLERDNLLQLETSRQIEVESIAAVMSHHTSYVNLLPNHFDGSSSSRRNTSRQADEDSSEDYDGAEIQAVNVEDDEDDGIDGYESSSPDKAHTYVPVKASSAKKITIQVASDEDSGRESATIDSLDGDNRSEEDEDEDANIHGHGGDHTSAPTSVSELHNIFNEEIGVYAASNSKIKMQFHATVTALKDCQSRLEEITKERDDLLARSQTMTEVFNTMRDQKVQVDVALLAANKKIAQYTTLAQDVQANFAKLEVEHEELLQESEATESQLQALESEHADILEEYEALKLTNQSLLNDISRLNAIIEELKQAQLSSDAQSLQQLQTMESELQTLRTVEKAVNESLQIVHTEKTSVTQQLLVVTETNVTLQSELEDLRAVHVNKVANLESLMAQRMQAAQSEIESLQGSLQCLQTLREDDDRIRSELSFRIEQVNHELLVIHSDSQRLRERLRVSESNHKATITAMMTILGLPEASCQRIIGDQGLTGHHVGFAPEGHTVSGSWNSFIDSTRTTTGSVSPGSASGQYQSGHSNGHSRTAGDVFSRTDGHARASRDTRLAVDMLSRSNQNTATKTPPSAATTHSSRSDSASTPRSPHTPNSKSSKLWQYAILKEIMRQMESFKSMQALDEEIGHIDASTWERFIDSKLSSSTEAAGYESSDNENYNEDGRWEPNRQLIQRVAPLYLRRKLIDQDVVQMSNELKTLVDELAAVMQEIRPDSHFPVTPLTHATALRDSLRESAEFSHRFSSTTSTTNSAATSRNRRSESTGHNYDGTSNQQG